MVCIATPALHADPLRTLMYRYNAVVQGYSTYGSVGTHGAEEHSGSEGSGGEGTITVLVQAATQDDGLVVDVTETVDRNARPMQTIRCAIYGNPNYVICDQNVDATAEEIALLEYLGRHFYDPSRLDAKGHWQVTQTIEGGKGSVISDYTVSKPDAVPVEINVSRVRKAWQTTASTTGSLTYDPHLSVPLTAHFSTDIQDGTNFGNSVIDLRLLSDSMAKSAP